MKNTVIAALICLILGLGIGYLFFYSSNESAPPTPSATVTPTTEVSPSESAAPTEPVDSKDLLETASAAVQLIKSGSYDALSEMVHPEDGVYFTPYSNVDFNSNVQFTAEQVKNINSDEEVYLWGTTDGEGAPINMTPKQYFKKYVFDQDYTTAPVIGRNYVVMSGNSIENVKEAYPDCQFVDFHFPGFDEQVGGMDWCTLRLVFREYEGSYKIVGIIHAQWTI